jgi:hypothetical protein
MSNCRAVVALNAVTASCELDAPHAGMAHHAVTENGTAMNWVSDGEARATQRRCVAERNTNRKANKK